LDLWAAENTFNTLANHGSLTKDQFSTDCSYECSWIW